MTLPDLFTRPAVAAAVALLLTIAACDPNDVIDDPPRNPDPAEMSGQELLDAALLAGCDSEVMMRAVERFVRAHQAAAERTEIGSEEYESILDTQEAPRLDRVFLASTSLHMNEMHDCQRLLVPAEEGWRYGPLVALFADPGSLARPDPEGSVVADVFDFGGGDYRPLGITVGSNCLWVEQDAAGAWSASILKPGSSGGGAPCAGTTPDNATDVTLLPTAVRGVQGNPPNPYPSTARWMWYEDEGEREGFQYIGFRCGDRWCEATPQAMAPDPSSFPNAEAVPGWSDGQYLGYVDTAGTLVVSGLFGTMEPGPAVKHAAADQEGELLDRAALAARITLVGDDERARDVYRDKMDFYAPAGGNPVTSRERLMMRVDRGTPRVWRAWTESRDVKRDLARAVGVDHSGSGTVRWRWVEDDEAGWIFCRLGCCTFGRGFF